MIIFINNREEQNKLLEFYSWTPWYKEAKEDYDNSPFCPFYAKILDLEFEIFTLPGRKPKQFISMDEYLLIQNLEDESCS